MNNELVFNQDGKVLTSSLLVAKTFGKEHARVMRDIRELSCSEGFRLGNFADTSYLDMQGKRQPMYHLTRDGFTLLVMGYTGKKAMSFKEAYISAFNQMESELSKPRQMSQLEILVQSAQALLEQNKRLEKVEQRLNQMEREREENGKLLLEVRVSDNAVPETSLRDEIRQLVNRYTAATNIDQRDVWHKIYDCLYYNYHISIRSYKKRNSRQTNLDIAEEHGFLHPMYDIISKMVKELKH
jgi:Rha family phage regulatory protein